jgi:hypothetical protein
LNWSVGDSIFEGQWAKRTGIVESTADGGYNQLDRFIYEKKGCYPMYSLDILAMCFNNL